MGQGKDKNIGFHHNIIKESYIPQERVYTSCGDTDKKRVSQIERQISQLSSS